MRRYTLYKYSTRLVAVLLATVLLLCSVPAVSAAEASGSCGSKLQWSLSGDTLTITGSGAMSDFPESTMAPWYDYRKQISTLRLPDGLTSIGDLAFYECSALKIVDMPNSVTSVGMYAFSGCKSITMLKLSSKLKTIEEGAFRECSAVTSLRLPATLTTIGHQGFYRCGSLTEIKIPQSVTKLGTSTFAYCYDLVRADVQANISELPDWTFFGCNQLTDVKLSASITDVGMAFYNCDSLHHVSYPGGEKDRDEIEKDILEGRGDPTVPTTPTTPDTPTTPTTPTTPGTPSTPGTPDTPGTPETPTTPGTPETPTNPTKPGNPTVLPDLPPEDPLVDSNEQKDESTNFEFDTDEDNNVVGNTTTTTTQTDNASMSAKVTVTYVDSGENKRVARISVTLETASGWNEISRKVTDIVDSVQETTLDIYIMDNSTLDKSAFNDLVGKSVIITIRNISGAVWRIDCSTLGKDAAHDLTYERLEATAEQLELMGCSVGYQIKFLSDAEVNAEVMIKLPVSNARRNASFFQTDVNEDKELLQTVVVDDEGYAHYYLSAVNSEVVYLIGMDVADVPTEEVIVPEELHADYGVSQLSTMEYVVTGRKSSWGMNIKQVTFILAGGMLGAVILIGFVMFLLNKRKLKMGYIPDIGDEDDDEGM